MIIIICISISLFLLYLLHVSVSNVNSYRQNIFYFYPQTLTFKQNVSYQMLVL